MGLHVLWLQMGSISPALTRARRHRLVDSGGDARGLPTARIAPEISLGAGLSGRWLVVSAGWRLRERVMAPAQALWRARADRERMGSADER
jgi:hypothetical protein